MSDQYGNSWIQYTQNSMQKCNDTSTYSFTAEVLCDETIVGQGNPQIINVDQTTCNVRVMVAHASGCPAG
jgi:hypothetical protein